MAMAVKSSLVYSSIGSGIQTPECWSSTGWEHETLTDSWEWEDPNSNYSTRQGEGHLRMQSNDWATASSSAVTLATKSDELSHVHALRTPGTSVSSGIPGVAAGGGSRGSDSSTLVKHEPDENGVTTRSGHYDSLFFSLGPPEEAERTQPQSNGSSSVMSGGGDSSQNVTLKLGRRTYLEDNARAPSVALSPPGKKQRPLSPSTHTPRCQVEGCRADLSGCKDYHKRHKVCEMHSKAPKAIAGGIEQRFCQQCSRFHILKEFDEGKRSCRRRLAGHNERRRKPHPETHSLFGLGSPFLHKEISTPTMGGAPFYFPDIKPSSALPPHRDSLLEYELHSYGHNLTRSNPWSLKSRNDNIPTFQIQNPKTPMTTLKPSPGLNLGGHHFLEGSSLRPLGQGLSLSSSTGGPLGSMEQQQQQSQHIGSYSQSLSSVPAGMMLDSGRALSLLSSQSWAPRPPQLSVASSTQAPVVSGGLSQAGDSTLEQLVASTSNNDSSNRGITSRFSHHLQQSSTTTSSAPPQQFDNSKQFSGGLNFGLTVTTGTTGTHEQRGGCGNNMLAGLGAYNNNETNNWGQDLVCHPHSHQGRATMDLMQTLPSVHAHHGGSHSNGVVHSQVSTSGLYNSGFSDPVRPYESSRFSDQQLL